MEKLKTGDIQIRNVENSALDQKILHNKYRVAISNRIGIKSKLTRLNRSLINATEMPKGMKGSVSVVSKESHSDFVRRMRKSNNKHR